MSDDIVGVEADRKRRAANKQRQQREEAAALTAWNRTRSSEHIWRGRAADVAVNELIRATEAGQRIVALPGMVAELRAQSFDRLTAHRRRRR